MADRNSFERSSTEIPTSPTVPAIVSEEREREPVEEDPAYDGVVRSDVRARIQAKDYANGVDWSEHVVD
jgi:hypothetical protein